MTRQNSDTQQQYWTPSQVSKLMLSTNVVVVIILLSLASAFYLKDCSRVRRRQEFKLCSTGLDQPFSLQDVQTPIISRHSTNEGGKIVSATHRPLLPPGFIPSTHSYQSLSRPQGHSVTGRIKSTKNPFDSMNPSGIKPANFRLLVQCKLYGGPTRNAE